MSGIVGSYNLNGRPAEPAVIRRMTDQLAHRGPDGLTCWLGGPVSLGHALLQTTPESLFDRQPLCEGSLSLTLDGRIDNREELRRALESHGAILRSNTDAELVLRAYQQWGKDCPVHLLGDFAFAIWDSAKQELFCARDQMGIRPFYYFSNDRVFLFASELRPLLGHSEVQPDLNEGMVGEYLTGEITSQEETLYRHLLRLPPSHCLTVSPGRFRMTRYWDFDPSKQLHYSNDESYRDHFLSILTESVRCRLRSHRPVGCYLSGGLDSSSVVSLAASLKKQGLATQGLESFSLLFPGLACDESPYIQDVTKLWDLPSNSICLGKEPDTAFADTAWRDRDFPGHPNGTMGNPLRALARDRGCRVLLTGTGGDEWLTGSYLGVGDLLRRGKVLTLGRRLRNDFGASGLPEVLNLALRYGLWPLLPHPLRQLIRKGLGRHRFPSWLDPDFAKRTRLRDRLQLEPDRSRYPSLAQADLALTIRSGWWAHMFEIEDRAASWFSLEERHPFADRRLAEFAVSLPEDQRWRGPQTKYLLRQAMQGILPETVRQRTTKAEFSTVFLQTLRALGQSQIFDSLQTADRGWIDAEKIQRAYAKIEAEANHHPDSAPSGLWPFWMVVGIELWLRQATMQQDLSSKEASFRWEPAPQPV